MGSEAVLDGNLAIVKDNTSGDTAEILEHLNQCIQEVLFILPAVCQDHGCAAVAHPGAEKVDGSFDAVQVDGSLTPVDLHGISRRKDKRNERLLVLLTKLFHQPPDGCLSAGKAAFGHQPVINPFGCVMLLLRATLTVLIHTLSDESHDILGKYDRLPGILLPLPWDAVAVPVFLDGVTGDMQHRCNLPLTHAVQPHPANLFINFHCYNHLCPPPIQSETIIEDCSWWLNYS